MSNTETAFELLSAEGANLIVIAEQVAAIEYSPSTWFAMITMKSGAQFTVEGNAYTRELVRFVRARGKPCETTAEAKAKDAGAPKARNGNGVTPIARPRSPSSGSD